MRTKDGYRFSLNFNADTAEKQRVGEFLENSGHKKSLLMVCALVEYLDRNPELESDGPASIEVKVKQTLSRAEIEEIVRSTIKAQLKEYGGVMPMKEGMTPGAKPEDDDSSTVDDAYVNQMIDNFGEFFG